MTILYQIENFYKKKLYCKKEYNGNYWVEKCNSRNRITGMALLVYLSWQKEELLNLIIAWKRFCNMKNREKKE